MAFEGRDLARLDPAAMQDLRGTRLSMVFQDPMTSLNPVRTVGDIMLDIQYLDHVTARAGQLTQGHMAQRMVGIR